MRHLRFCILRMTWQRSEVTVITGSNDYVRAKYDTHNEFVFTVDKSVEGVFWRLHLTNR